MTIFNHTLGFPRIGLNRELKKAQEDYWSGNLLYEDFLCVGSQLRRENWKKQKDAGIDYIPVGDFAWYDHVLSTSMMLGNIPERHLNVNDNKIDLDCLFRIARGCSPDVAASEMTKWFNTNYHYIVPEFNKNRILKFSWKQILEETDEALLLGYKVKPIILGPITYLWLGKIKGEYFDRLDLLKNILPIYKQVLRELSQRNIDFVQIDEPALVLDLPEKWKKAYSYAYEYLNGTTKILLTTYFDSIEHNIEYIRDLPIYGIHIDLVFGKYNLFDFNSKLPKEWILSLGVINGRNVWRADLIKLFKSISTILKFRKKLLIGSSCSLLHSPIDLQKEKNLDKESKKWFSFAVQKCTELSLLSKALNKNDTDSIQKWCSSIYERNFSKRVQKIEVQNRLSEILNVNFKRSDSYNIRSREQKKKFNLPILPTTTIGSFPQTLQIRKLRRDYKQGLINDVDYEIGIKKHIKEVIKEQEKLGIDVLVHGEPERNDMVEYFGENLDGFIFTDNGWVQSYGSRCVKPPIIIGDVSRLKPITVKWSKYAQSLTDKPVKAMLTGPVTILFWSFPREDISLEKIAKQIGLALRDEVLDLEKEKIEIIQIDEPALREGLPLRKSLWNEYLSWAVDAFRLSSSGVKNTTQIHTHMCYCEFHDIMHAISFLDADVITIETARSDMELLKSFKTFKYPNEIGPGVYDIHSSNIPSITSIKFLLNKAIAYIPVERIWVNPDCGLKTRNWNETILALKNMVCAAKEMRDKIKKIT
ncbi:5-methyltetrahydropteroyltriglutamate--homocysteine S-methyltransferase [Buchnera aphidicola]|jgi:5-methyltetrahydropteroyltriglutamate--homocysteine methyltransferase|uniref:5-methyltetrahydropteroyltriglutamate--homocysteine methyltransferase n=1 Tax=Buchnera aphidicola subsp. Schizaphis graminum (strain Sg) TaxID=198804 RepID=METE_BUCAP|nr:5-methyltetrahydropteroyltriglutamate--homocysteine S-methyltransferase [Buchnera aphidicola]Q8KA71.1 RecName: Full=5-methyltetrahydropteroyltriglutamate--homocysteine methyltransferase; AltName: Full=Cobalamin-independent methionine synthase; AltName: Full=Methionine synthase, vitamin-B12 independent isozyme [Buchnera aphidicola str. Sg (Schizaphis graminum)]AAM67602.1 5-methyltetrahydropteroyltriglutamate--homocystein [Buchnera aphidicola str. Sg (Schizaphis graminum)]AWI49896.1 5-methyltet